MNEKVKRILDLFKDKKVLSILESKNNYIVSVADKDTPINDAAESIFAVNKKTGKISEFSYFNNPDEYAEANKNVLYRFENNELKHHGILGQKWGVRRFQNKDGSLTRAGRKRAAKLEAEYEKVTGRKVESYAKSKGGSSKKKSVKDMTDDELRERIQRLQLERQLDALDPKIKTKGEIFLDNVKDVVVPAVKTATRNNLTKLLDDKLADALGTKSKDTTEALKKEVEKLELYKRKKDAVDYLSGKKNSSDSLASLAKEYEDRQKIDKGQKYFKEGKYTESKSSPDSNNGSNNSSDNSSSRMHASRGPKFNSWSSNRTDDNVYGEGTSRYREKDRFRTDDAVDAVYREIYQYPATTSGSSYESGRSYVNQYLLEDKKW